MKKERKFSVNMMTRENYLENITVAAMRSGMNTKRVTSSKRGTVRVIKCSISMMKRAISVERYVPILKIRLFMILISRKKKFGMGMMTMENSHIKSINEEKNIWPFAVSSGLKYKKR